MKYREIKTQLDNLLKNGSKLQVFDFLENQKTNKSISNEEYSKLLVETKDYYIRTKLLENFLDY